MVLESVCWMSVVIVAWLGITMGPAVSPDQFVVRTIVVGGAIAAVVVFRFRAWRQSRRHRDV